MSQSELSAQDPPQQSGPFEFIPSVDGVKNKRLFETGQLLRSILTSKTAITNTASHGQYLLMHVEIRTAPFGNPPRTKVVGESAGSVWLEPGASYPQGTPNAAIYTVPDDEHNYYTGSAEVWWSTTPNMLPDRSNIIGSVFGASHEYRRAEINGPGGQ